MIPGVSAEVKGEGRLVPLLGQDGNQGWAGQMGQPHLRLEQAIVNDGQPQTQPSQSRGERSSDAPPAPTRTGSATTGAQDRFGPGSTRPDGFAPFVRLSEPKASSTGQAGPAIAEPGPVAGPGKAHARRITAGDAADASARFLGETTSVTTVDIAARAGSGGPGDPGGPGGPGLPGESDPEEPTVWIVSPGKHANDPGDPPKVLQGSRYVAREVYTHTPINLGDQDVEWVPEKWTWAYPPKVAKGYGVFETVYTDPDGPFTRFVAQPSDAQRTKVQWQGCTPDDMDYDSTQRNDQGLVVDHFIDAFYWGPENEGIETVSLSMVFRKYVNGQATDKTVTKGDSVTLEVLKPTGTITKLHEGTTGVSAPVNGDQLLAFDYRFDTELSQYPPGTLFTPQLVIDQVQDVGIKWQADVQLPNNNTTGEFTVVQIVSSSGTWIREPKPPGNQFTRYFRLPKLDASGLPIISAANNEPETVPAFNLLDTTFPFCGDDQAYRQSGQNKIPAATAPIGWSLKSYDNPDSSLPTETNAALPISMLARDDSKVTLMYTPAATTNGQISDLQAIWVPVAISVWHWYARANYTAGSNPPWSLGTDHGQYVQDVSNAAHANDKFPSWERNLTEADWYVNA